MASAASPAGNPLRLSPQIDVEAVAEQFRARRRVSIAPFLDPALAAMLLDYLRASQEWRLVLNSGERVVEIDRAGQAAMTAEQWAQLDQLVDAAAEHGFQFRFETIRVSDDRAERLARGSLLDAFAELMNSPETLSLMRRVTGIDDIDFADAQATSYSAGHFLTTHDDDVDGKNRRAAYVFGLSEHWDPRWGGQLQFHRPDGTVDEQLAPRFNCLNIFAVPQLHSVTRVSPEARKARISVTGWLRATHH